MIKVPFHVASDYCHPEVFLFNALAGENKFTGRTLDRGGTLTTEQARTSFIRIQLLKSSYSDRMKHH